MGCQFSLKVRKNFTISLLQFHILYGILFQYADCVQIKYYYTHSVGFCRWFQKNLQNRSVVAVNNRRRKKSWLLSP